MLNVISSTGRIDSIATTSSIVLAILGSIGNTVVVGLRILEVKVSNTSSMGRNINTGSTGIEK